jgi:hypothetical protein
MTKEDWRKREHKRIALEKLGDAVALFKRDRYLASFYLVGYVFEMGTQYELKRLGDIRLADETALAVVTRLSADAIVFHQGKNPIADINNLWEQSRELHQKIVQRNLSVDSLYEFMTKFTRQSHNNIGQQKQLSAIIKDRPLFWALVKGRLDSNIPGVEGHHDTVKLLETLAEWSSVLGESRVASAIYEDFTALKWKVELRYEYTKDNTQNREYCQTARKALGLAYQLLTQIMGCKVTDLPNIQKLKC